MEWRFGQASRGCWGVLSRGSVQGAAPFHSNTLSLRSAFPFSTRATLSFPIFLFPSTMGRKLDPTKKEKRGPGRKARKQKGAETELARFLPAGKGQACLLILQLLCRLFICVYNPPRFLNFYVHFLFKWNFLLYELLGNNERNAHCRQHLEPREDATGTQVLLQREGCLTLRKLRGREGRIPRR